MRSNRFTLIEMLVVIAIIAILASFLMPSLMRSLEMAKTTSCASNMKQCNVAMMLYVEDNYGMLPPAATTISGSFNDWFPQVAVTRYSGTGQSQTSAAVGNIAYCTNKRNIYGFNASSGNDFGLFPWNKSFALTSVTNASKVIMFADRSYVRGERWFRNDIRYLALAHMSGLNLLKFAGSVEYRSFPWLEPFCEVKDIPNADMFSAEDFKRRK